MNCIIIEDHPESRTLVEIFVKKTGSLNLINSHGTAVEAINSKDDKEDIDLVFLDIELPEMTGMEYLRTLTHNPQVIILSAQDKYALEAFEYDVTDYLLKPVTYSRFFKAVNKALIRYKKSKNIVKAQNEIFIRKDSSLIKLKFEEIWWIEAMENYVMVNTETEKYTVHFTLKGILTKLPIDIFQQIHRSYILNLNKIDMIKDNSVILKLDEYDKTIPIGKSFRENLYNNLNLISH